MCVIVVVDSLKKVILDGFSNMAINLTNRTSVQFIVGNGQIRLQVEGTHSLDWWVYSNSGRFFEESSRFWSYFGIAQTLMAFLIGRPILLTEPQFNLL